MKKRRKRLSYSETMIRAMNFILTRNGAVSVGFVCTEIGYENTSYRTQRRKFTRRPGMHPMATIKALVRRGVINLTGSGLTAVLTEKGEKYLRAYNA